MKRAPWNTTSTTTAGPRLRCFLGCGHYWLLRTDLEGTGFEGARLQPCHRRCRGAADLAAEGAGFSYRVKKEIGSIAEIWQRGFSDHRIREAEDYAVHVQYIRLNPVKKRLCEIPVDYKHSSAFPGWKLDPIPQRLKPQEIAASYGRAEAVPFQSAQTQKHQGGT